MYIASPPNCILLVGAQEGLTNLVSLLKSQSWPVTAAASPIEALRQIRAEPLVDIAVLAPSNDLDAHIELCRAIKLDTRTSTIVVIFVLPPHLDDYIADIFATGADDCIRSCASNREISLRLQKAIRVRRTTDLLEDASAVVAALANAVEAKDRYTYGHVDRVAAYSVGIGRRLGIEADGIASLKAGGVFHDIGKVGIPDHVLNKPGKLTDEEMDIMRRHPVIGYEILKPLRTFQHVLPIVRWHHERPNGSGYPDGLKGEEIPLLARVTAVADVFDALSTDRPYRSALPLPKCQAILADAAAKGDLDPELVRLMLEILAQSMPMLAGVGGAGSCS